MVEKITNQFPTVFRNDEISLEDINYYDMIMLSPGPGIPKEAGILKDIIYRYAGKKPIFGVCLGLQAIVEVFGSTEERIKMLEFYLNDKGNMFGEDETLVDASSIYDEFGMPVPDLSEKGDVDFNIYK